MVRTLTFNRSHKNGWISYKLQGVPGAVFIDGKMLTDEGKASPQATLDLDVFGMREPGADQTEAARLKAEKKAEREVAKAARVEASAAKATAKLEKLQAAAAKAQAKAEAIAAKAASANVPA